jgi:hypothetical protein
MLYLPLILHEYYFTTNTTLLNLLYEQAYYWTAAQLWEGHPEDVNGVPQFHCTKVLIYYFYFVDYFFTTDAFFNCLFLIYTILCF